jgi:hypothetical protein
MYFSAKFSKEFNPSVLSFMDSVIYCSQDKFRQFDTIVYNLSGCHIYPGAVAALCDNSCPLVDTSQNAIEYVRNMIDDIITAINLVYCNFEHDVQCLLDNDIKRRTLAKNAYQTMESEWNADVAAERLIKLIESEFDSNLFTSGPCSKAKIIKG